MKQLRLQPPIDACQGGVAIEMAMTLIIALMLSVGVLDLARWWLAVASTTEATRLGARLASLCDLNDSVIRQRTLARLVGVPVSGMAAPQVQISYTPSGCNSSNCAGVSVALQQGQWASVVPFLPNFLPLPQGQQYQPREALSSTTLGRINPICD